MTALALVLSFLPGPTLGAPRPYRVQDVEFARVQEDWIARAAPHSSTSGRITPIVQRLGDHEWLARDAAHKAIARNVRRHFAALVTAERISPDPEIRDRATNILDGEFCVCRGQHEDYAVCPLCENSLDLRFVRIYDDLGRYRVYRDLFSPERMARDFGVRNDPLRRMPGPGPDGQRLQVPDL